MRYKVLDQAGTVIVAGKKRVLSRKPLDVEARRRLREQIRYTKKLIRGQEEILARLLTRYYEQLF